MQVKEKLEITIIGKQVKIKVIGGNGKSCIEQTKELEKRLGEVINRELCDDYKTKVFITQEQEQKMRSR